MKSKLHLSRFGTHDLLASLLLLTCACQVPAATRFVTSLGDSGPGTLRQAILDASSGDTITLAVAGTITLATGEILIGKDLSILGTDPATITVSGNSASRVFNISGGTVSLNGITVAHGQPWEDKGGGVINQGRLSATNCWFLANRPYGTINQGGAIFNSGSLILDHCVVSNNYVAAPHDNPGAAGAGVYNEVTATLFVNQSTFSDNRVSFGSGGAIWNAGTLIVTASLVSSNTGGGIVNSGTLALTNCTVSGNSGSSGSGNAAGGISTGGTAYIVSSQILANTVAGGNGGGIASGANYLLVSGSVVSGNAATSGGGIANGGTIVVVNSTVSSNRTLSGIGGGVYNYSISSQQGFLATNSTLSGNTAASGGGIYNESGSVAITGGTISGNSATSDGGGIYYHYSYSSATLRVLASTITRNRANRGGGIYTFGTTKAFVRNSIVAGNSVAPGGIGPDCSGEITSQDFNLIQNTSGLSIIGLPSHDLYGKDPRLGPLQNNGGPTWTHAVLPGSPAIDAGNSSGQATDQRGHSRTTAIPSVPNASGGDGSDIGAFELDNLIVGIQKIGPDVLVQFITAPSQIYHLQYAPALPASGWTDLPISFAGTGGILCATNSGVGYLPARFYRVRQE